MPDTAKTESYYCLDSFEPGDTIYIHNFGMGKPVLGARKYAGQTSNTKLGVALEPVFQEAPGSHRGVIVIGPEIRLYDEKYDRYGPVVGLVSSFKSDPRLKTKQKSAFRRRLGKMFDSDGPVVIVFMAVLLVLGIAVGGILALMIFG